MPYLKKHRRTTFEALVPEAEQEQVCSQAKQAQEQLR